MGGSGGFGWSKPSDIAKEVREAEKKVADEEFQTELAGLLAQLLARFNDRDAKLVRNRLDDILEHLEDISEKRLTQIFGGSVAKHTYVDGLSDIDCLLILDDAVTKQSNPQEIIADVAAKLKARLSERADVSVGNLAVTVAYRDGMEIQILPAVQDSGRLKIPSSREPRNWSSIDPQKFQEALTKYNAKCDGKLVPTIKLAKAIIGQLPDAHQLSGYHIESLAIDAFKDYQGTKAAFTMLPHLFKHAKDRVLNQMTDSTGQSVHVDEYMGSANSEARQNASHILGRIAKRMDNATAASSVPQWRDMFGIE